MIQKLIPARLLALLIALPTALLLAACSGMPLLPQPLSAATGLPYQLERLDLPGPVQGVLARINLADPRVRVQVALADPHDPDGTGPCVGQLDTTSNAARRHDFALTLNASFFAAPQIREFAERKIRYFVGNCAIPQGWHASNGKVFTQPARESLRAALVVHADGRVSLLAHVAQLPADARYAVSGSALILSAGRVTPALVDVVRHPRSAVGLSADGKTLLLLAIDGRQAASRGATLAELAEILQRLGAHDALNLDGGGSTALVVKDPGSGVFAVANQPSDNANLAIPLRTERPVADVVGISLMPDSAATK